MERSFALQATTNYGTTQNIVTACYSDCIDARHVNYDAGWRRLDGATATPDNNYRESGHEQYGHRRWIGGPCGIGRLRGLGSVELTEEICWAFSDPRCKTPWYKLIGNVSCDRDCIRGVKWRHVPGADSDQPTQRGASSDVQITVSATGVLRLLDHVCGTCYKSIYSCVTVSDSLNSCWRPICLVFGTVALCAVLVRSAVYKLSYLLTYFISITISTVLTNVAALLFLQSLSARHSGQWYKMQKCY